MEIEDLPMREVPEFTGRKVVLAVARRAEQGGIMELRFQFDDGSALTVSTPIFNEPLNLKVTYVQ